MANPRNVVALYTMIAIKMATNRTSNPQLLRRCFETLIVCSNTTVLKLQTVLFLFFPNSALPNWGCGLSTDAAYTWTFT
ncbi:hypothetical protein pdam_00001076, partial [Pocillopora damicornis]